MTLLGISLAIVWIIVPFAVFGIKSRLDRVIALLSQIKSQNEIVNPALKATIPTIKTIDACSKCVHLKADVNKCTKTGWKLNVWIEKHYPQKKMNPCEGIYFKEIR